MVCIDSDIGDDQRNCGSGNFPQSHPYFLVKEQSGNVGSVKDDVLTGTVQTPEVGKISPFEKSRLPYRVVIYKSTNEPKFTEQ